ncbi:hypothetical protein STIAU_2881, partial [Stigmatella aurantiaca DW4/3-1]
MRTDEISVHGDARIGLGQFVGGILQILELLLR